MNKPANDQVANVGSLDCEIVKEDLDPVEDFHVLDWSPKSGYVGDQTKVVVYGEFKSGKSRNGLYCKIGHKVVKAEIHENGLSFTTPIWWASGHEGFCIIDDKGRLQSNLCVFERIEYRREKMENQSLIVQSSKFEFSQFCQLHVIDGLHSPHVCLLKTCFEDVKNKE